MDGKLFLKSADIGQMLQVFENEMEKEATRAQITKTIYGEYYNSGLTPPTHQIVKRRFELTRKSDSFLPYKVREVIDEINQGDPWHYPDTYVSNQTAISSNIQNLDGLIRKKETTDNNPDDVQNKAIIEVVEEVVDFEDWMVDEQAPDGISITLSGSDWWSPPAMDGVSTSALNSSNESAATSDTTANYARQMKLLGLLIQHPEILQTEVDVEEDSIDNLMRVKKQEAKQQQQQRVTNSSDAMDVVPTTTMTSKSNNITHTDATTTKPSNIITTTFNSTSSNTKADAYTIVSQLTTAPRNNDAEITANDEVDDEAEEDSADEKSVPENDEYLTELRREEEDVEVEPENDEDENEVVPESNIMHTTSQLGNITTTASSGDFADMHSNTANDASGQQQQLTQSTNQTENGSDSDDDWMDTV